MPYAKSLILIICDSFDYSELPNSWISKGVVLSKGKIDLTKNRRCFGLLGQN